MDRQQVETEIKKLARRSFWVGVILGLVVGFLAGFLVSQATVKRSIVIPLSEGIKA